MSYLPDAEQVFLGKCGLDNEELAALRERERENYKVVWTVQLGKKLTARTDATTFMPVGSMSITSWTTMPTTCATARKCSVWAWDTWV